jgi:hypothetical protein
MPPSDAPLRATAQRTKNPSIVMKCEVDLIMRAPSDEQESRCFRIPVEAIFYIGVTTQVQLRRPFRMRPNSGCRRTENGLIANETNESMLAPALKRHVTALSNTGFHGHGAIQCRCFSR